MNRRIIFCSCRGEIIPPAKIATVFNQIEKINTEIIRLHDLCGICATRAGVLKHFFTTDDQLLIIACNPRSVKNLLLQAGIEYENFSITFANLITENETEIIEKALHFATNDPNGASVEEIRSNATWPAWYPVIDYSRCINCGQCADFCLFGVYSKNEPKVRVIQPQNCKINCPACARICPQTAIIFPKYKEGGAISGTDTIDEIAEQQRKQKDITTFLGSDIYQTLEMRKNRRKSIINAEAMKKALDERDSCKKEENN